MSESEHRMIEILRILNIQEKPIGSKVIADELKTKGYNLGERAVRYHMQILDEKSLNLEEANWKRVWFTIKLISHFQNLKREYI